MAIKKSIENEFGTSFNYHKIKDIRIVNSDNGVQLSIIVDSYVSKEARITGKSPVRTENIISNADFALSPFYALLTSKFTQYADAEDDFDNSFKSKTDNKSVRYTQQTMKGNVISSREEFN